MMAKKKPPAQMTVLLFLSHDSLREMAEAETGMHQDHLEQHGMKYGDVWD